MVNFCKKNFLHKRLVEILTQTPFSLVILTNIYLGLKKKKKTTGARKYKQSQIIQLFEIVNLLY